MYAIRQYEYKYFFRDESNLNFLGYVGSWIFVVLNKTITVAVSYF